MSKFLFAALLAPGFLASAQDDNRQPPPNKALSSLGLIASPQDATTPATPATPAAPATAPAAPAAPAAAKDPSLADLVIKPAADNPMMFDQAELTVKPGQKVKLTLDNPIQPNVQGLPHNWVLVKPGKEAVVGNAALAMAADPKAMQKHYIPASADGGVHPDILAHTTLANPGSKAEAEFTAPAEAGDYPFICTFPGHFLLMKGTLHVK